MQLKRTIIQFSITRPGLVISLALVITLMLGFLLTRVHVTASPINILSKNDPVRLFSDQAAKEFGLHDIVLLAVTNTTHKNGAFNLKTLKKIYQLSRYAASLTDPEDAAGKVIASDIIAPDTVETIEQAGLGKIRLQRLMPTLPKSEQEALRIRDKLLDNPRLKGTMISADGKSLAIYLPISQKNFACKVRQRLETKITALGRGEDHFYITGLPLAEETFARKLLPWTSILLSLTLLVISLLMLGLFSNKRLLIVPMILIPCVIISTMGLLIVTGHTLDTISSMIPFFIVAVTVVYCIQVLSALADGYKEPIDTKQIAAQVMHHLFKPMLFSTLISAAGFASLAFTRLHTLRTFGIFVAIGTMLAWFLSMLLIPSCFVLLHQHSWTRIFVRSSTNYAKQREQQPDSTGIRSIFNHLQHWIIKTATEKPWLIIGINLLIMVPGAVGILMIRGNENPMQWFQRSSELRIASRIFNQQFSGTYDVNLILAGTGEKQSINEAAVWLSNTLTKSLKKSPIILEKALAEISQAVAENSTGKKMAKRLSLSWETEIDHLAPEDDAGYEAWSRALDTLDRLRNQNQIFKRPDLLNYLLSLQKNLKMNPTVGKSNSIADIVQTVHRQLFEGDPGHFSIPATTNGVAQALASYQTENHHPDALLHLVTPDYTRANLGLQLRSGDNKDMEQIIDTVNRFLAENPPPTRLKASWTGPAYINMVAQKKMSLEIRRAVLTGLMVVFIACAILLRSLLLSMPIIIVPAAVTCIVFGIPGLVGRTIAMPIAILSFLPLGISVHFAIRQLHHFQAATLRKDKRPENGQIMTDHSNFNIISSAIVLSLGCIPLLFSPLIPYRSTGVFLAAVTLFSGSAALWVIPALLTVLQKWFIKNQAPASADDSRQAKKAG